MLVLAVALITGIAAGFARGGRLRNLEHLDLRLSWLVLVALGIQIVIFSPLGAPLSEAIAIAAHLSSYALLLTFALLNRRHAGICVAGIGTALNVIAIAANGGYMPTTERALSFAGLDVERGAHNNSLLDEGVRLLPLGDIMAVPDWVPLVANVFSIGDVLIAAGVALLLATAMRDPELSRAHGVFKTDGEPEAQ